MSAIHFKVGEIAVHLFHGPGVIVSVESKEFVEGLSQRFYIFEIADNECWKSEYCICKKVFVPFNSDRLRRVSTQLEIERALKALSKTELDSFDHQSWNRRYREYMDKIQSGKIMEIAEVAGSLFRLKDEKDLSFGERKLLDSALTRLVTEIALSLNITDAEAEKKIENALRGEK